MGKCFIAKDAIKLFLSESEWANLAKGIMAYMDISSY